MTRLHEFLQQTPLKQFFVVENGKKRQATEEERQRMIEDAYQKSVL